MAYIALVVTNACAPDPRVERHARWLAEEGHKVVIHAWDRTHSHPSESIKNGYKIKRYRIGSSGKLGPIRTLWRKKQFRDKLKIKANVIVFNDTDSFNLEGIKGKKLLDMHDLAHTWPLMRSKGIFARLLSSHMLGRAKLAMKKCNAIITSSPGFKIWIRAHGHESTVVLNRRNPCPIPPQEKEVVGYFGRIRDLHAMEVMITAAEMAGFHVITAGDGHVVDELIKRHPELDHRGPFTEEDLPKLMEEISVMYAMYNPSRGNISDGALPVKMFDAAAFGRPSLVNSDEPMGEYCLANNLGSTATFGNIAEVAESLDNLHGMVVEYDEGEDREIFLSVIKSLL